MPKASDVVDFDAQAFGVRLREERERLGLSQQMAADGCGVRREMWGKYERGAAEPGARVVAAMGRMGADALYLLLGRPEPKLRAGEGLVSPVRLASLARDLKAEFERWGLTEDMYPEPQIYWARIVLLAGEIYNALCSSGREAADLGAEGRNMARGAAISERSRLVEENGSATPKTGT
ncbi:helix-turn-helix domain-containing protein [Piscinibacter koreensis]|uniref:Helix-turn-helix transcriptional regulator n=1 Tax=Piscinibacter koreensis TaxID=2742824 RepID=A0A7Y6NP08_9BURK|nr:helix-turn-helix domain-containing protein [Schlegelella koreensis]NUZ06717.1 helix-turn-helix transcriptional regulator [Schlegelella koreensis]